MIDPRLGQQLEKVAARLRRRRFWRGLGLAWLLAAALGLLTLGVERATGWFLPITAGELFALAVLLAVAFGWLAHRSVRNYQTVAARIEAAYPELKTCLLAAMEQRPALAGGRFGYLQDRVVRQALNHAYGHGWPRVVPSSSMATALLANAVALPLLLFVLSTLRAHDLRRPGTAAADAASATSPSERLTVTIEPGDTEVERGTSLLVLARFAGPQPAQATLVYEPAEGEPARLNMAKSLDDPVFGGRIPVVDAALAYRVELADVVSDTFHVSVFEHPKLERADARLVYPQYTDMVERLVEDVRTISAVEGTELTLICHLNKPVASATLAENDSPPIALRAVDDQPLVREATLTCDKSRKLVLELIDDDGRRNKQRVEFTINVLANKPPDLKLATPARDIEVSPLEETDIQATAWDDFGIKRFGLTYTLAGGEPVEVVLGHDAAAQERHELKHVIRMEELEAEPDQLLSYHLWAEDAGPNGKPRRTEGDMYFAEVRPFDEIFRQGQQPPGGGGQQQQGGGGESAQAAEKLLQLQKDIVNATWKVIRREASTVTRSASEAQAETRGVNDGKEPSPGFRDDVRLIAESQTVALDQANKAAEKLTDPRSQAHAAEATKAMQQAIDQLQAAQGDPALEPLRPALAAEQSAYQALLKLRAREHSVVRGRQQGGGGGGGSNRSQQQLQQLELKNDENRYETQRLAQSQPPEQRETRQVLNRLGELARRQNDLNERLKELQSALEEAQSEPEREEIRRQLKRLREEQEEILRDTDELKSRMERPENQRMADARRQLEETRDQVQGASEALANEKVSQAAAAGTRAARDFQELRNDFRRLASGQFSDEMREMRDEARQLDEKEKEVAQRLATDDSQRAEKSLRGDDPSEALSAELTRQKERLAELLDHMRETIGEAETPEPLLAERLYDAARKVQSQNLDRALEAAELSLRRGLADDARQQERLAGQGIGELRQGIERAAQSVLGDDTEALRRARDELERLAEELGNEIARNTGEEPAEANSAGREDEDAEKSFSDFNTLGPNKNSRLSDNANEGKVERSSAQARNESPDRAEAGSPSDEQSAAQGGERPQSGQERGPQGGSQAGDRQANANQPRGSGQAGQSDQRGDQPTGGGRGMSASENRGQNRAGGNSGGGNSGGGDPSGLGGFAPFFEPGQRTWSPIAGDDFRDWSDRLRDVEEMIDQPELRAQAARIRERSRGIRAEIKRHSKVPNWELIKIDVSRPLHELRDRVAEELLRRTSNDALLPLDRDPVPPKYSQQTRRYYQRLGSGR